MMIQQIQMNQEELKRFSSQRTANLVLANQKRAANAGPASQPRVLQRLAVPKPPTQSNSSGKDGGHGSLHGDSFGDPVK
jgi:hypothetical protein